MVREVKILAELNHSNVVCYHQTWIEDIDGPLSADDESYGTDTSGPPRPPTKILYLAMEFCHGTLERFIEIPLQPIPIEKYFTQMVLGLTYIHEKGIIHRDLSKQNILLDS
ncbi:uncharacterized protein [Henckelia pumila]|uniref:uncharacterized protein n=1 Tax=Henckelia pumila TaxID=405737 RepID=UPI003C6E7A65